jgi:hypothetical protein
MDLPCGAASPTRRDTARPSRPGARTGRLRIECARSRASRAVPGLWGAPDAERVRGTAGCIAAALGARVRAEFTRCARPSWRGEPRPARSPRPCVRRRRVRAARRHGCQTPRPGLPHRAADQPGRNSSGRPRRLSKAPAGGIRRNRDGRSGGQATAWRLCCRGRAGNIGRHQSACRQGFRPPGGVRYAPIRADRPGKATRMTGRRGPAATAWRGVTRAENTDGAPKGATSGADRAADLGTALLE